MLAARARRPPTHARSAVVPGGLAASSAHGVARGPLSSCGQCVVRWNELCWSRSEQHAVPGPVFRKPRGALASVAMYDARQQPSEPVVLALTFRDVPRLRDDASGGVRRAAQAGHDTAGRFLYPQKHALPRRGVGLRTGGIRGTA